MSFPLIPDRVYGSIYDIDLAALSAAGITLMLADLDNTISPYSVAAPTGEVRAWSAALSAHGIALFVVSNNRSQHRIKDYCNLLGVPYIDHAGKPRAASFLRAMEQMGRTPSQTVMVGDQIFTDVMGGRNAGIKVLLVRPIDIGGNPLRTLRYGLEQPFRALGKRKRN